MQKVYSILGLLLILALLSTCQAQQSQPTTIPTATSSAEAVLTPTILANPSPSTSSDPLLDLGGQQLLLVNYDQELFFWDGINPPKERGRMAGSVGVDYVLTLDYEREVLLMQHFDWLEARSLRNNQRLWLLPMITQSAHHETTIVDAVNDPFNDLIWIVEKQTSTDLLQPALVHIRGIDSLSGIETRRYQAPFLRDHPYVLPTAAGLWLLADGQLFPFDLNNQTFGEPFLQGLEFAQVAADGKRALVFGNGSITEIELATKQTLKQTSLERLPQTDRLVHMLVSADLSYVVLVGSPNFPSSNSEQIMAYDREGRLIGHWDRHLVVESRNEFDPNNQPVLQFLDDHRLMALRPSGNMDLFDLSTGRAQVVLTARDSITNQQRFNGFVVLPKLNLLPVVYQSELEKVDLNPLAPQPLTPVTKPQPLLLSKLGFEYEQVDTHGEARPMAGSILETITRSNAPPLLVKVNEYSVDIFDPTNQTTITLDVDPAEGEYLSDFAGVSAPDNRNIVVCVGYYLDSSVDSRVNRCLEVDLQTGQTKSFGKMPATSQVIPIYWDGQQLTILTTAGIYSDEVAELWQILAEDRSQIQKLLQPSVMQQFWYVVGSPTLAYHDAQDRLYTYALQHQQAQLLVPDTSNKQYELDLAPNGQTVMLFERRLPLKYGLARMLDTATGLELWRDPLRQMLVGHWSGDSHYYVLENPRTINSSLETISLQGQSNAVLYFAKPLSWSKSDWAAQHLLLKIDNMIYLLAQVNQAWLPVSTLAGNQVRGQVEYIYPQP